MFKFLIIIHPLGFLYGSAGAFLSPENLVGRSGTKFPPDAAALSGLMIYANQEKNFTNHQELKDKLVIAGAFWATDDDFKYGKQNFYVPISRHRIIDETQVDEWRIEEGEWTRANKDVDATYTWQSIHSWNKKRIDLIKKSSANEVPWKFNPVLHPTLEDDQRRVHISTDADGKSKGSLFLENSVQMREDSYLVYLSTHELPNGWYRFGGESHIVEVESQPIESDILEIFQRPIERSFALICPAVWGTNNLSYRYPKDIGFSNKCPKMLTDRPIPFRYRMGGSLGIGRYAVPAGTVYIVRHPLNKTWWDFPAEWFPKIDMKKSRDQRPLPLKHLGCGLCLPITIQGV